MLVAGTRREQRGQEEGPEAWVGISYLDGRVPGQSALELLEPARDLVAEGGVALLVVDLLAEQTAALGGGVGSVLASHFVVVVGAGGLGGWAERCKDF
jgi:hypothetical protein